ncbi:MAG TPA: 2'-5' RNA ligase family protein [Candidatus Limnocylindria bacterium]|nr:2'-5' RNA ligase family protein [Candidatus Limnocylindria bacterium]
MSFAGNRSAIVVPVRLPKPLEQIRLAHVDNARLDVPAHVTLLFPFLAPASIDTVALAALADAMARTPPFWVAFRRVETFDPGPTPEGVAWLAPDPAAPFAAMTRALTDAFPGLLPYGGMHDEVIPHLTLANVDVDLAAIRAEAGTYLPFRRHVDSAALLVESLTGRWRIGRRMVLG